MKILKNKFVLGLVLIIILVLIIFGYSKIKEYNILKDVFVFKQEDIVSVWRRKKDENNHDYNYKLKNNEVDALSSITLVPIDKHSVYVFLQINKLRDDGSSNMQGVMDKSYIIDSEKLV